MNLRTPIVFLRCTVMAGVVAMLTVPASAQLDTTFQRAPISYATYLALVGKNNLGYIAQQFNLGIADAGIELAKVFPDPLLNYGAYDIGQERLRMGYGFNAGIGTTLELGGKRRARINLAQSQAELARVQLQNYFRNLRADATNIFLQSLMQENIFKVKINSYQSMRKLATSDSIRLRLGSIMEIDARQTNVEARSMLNDAFQSEADWKASMLQLGMMIGKQKHDTLFDARGGFSRFDREFVLADLITAAENQRADLLAALKSKDVSQRNLDLARANRVIDLGISMSISSTSVVTNYVAPTPSFTNVFGGVSIPLRLSNKYTGDIKSAEFALRQSETLYQQVELQIETEVTQGFFNYLQVRKQAKQFNTGLLEDAKKVFEGKVYSYQRGKSSLLEVLSAQRTYNEVRLSYYLTLYNYAVALVELERAAGYGTSIFKGNKMKIAKIAAVLLTVLVTAGVSVAQNGIVGLGVKAGLNKPMLRGRDAATDFPSSSSDFSNFMVGVSATSRTGKYIWLKHEVFFAQRFMTTQMSDPVNGTYASKFKRHYIDIYPISPTLQFKGLQVFAGPYLGALLNATVQQKNASGQLQDVSIYGNPTQNSNYAQKFDFGFVVGVEYEFKFGVNLGIRYTKGFVPLLENTAQQTQQSVYNSFVSVVVGYTLWGKIKDAKNR